MKNGTFKIGHVVARVQNGFRNRITFLGSHIGLVPGLALLVLSIIALFGDINAGFASAVAPIVVALKIKKDGLEGDNLKFVTDLEKRFEEISIKSGLSEEEATALHTKALNDALAPYTKLKGIDPEKVEEMLKLKQTIIDQGVEITKLKNLGRAPENVSVRAQVEEWVTKNKGLIDNIKSGQKQDLPEFKIKAAATMLESTHFGGSTYLPNVQVLPGYIDLVRVQPTFWGRLLKPATKANPLVWVNKYNKQGNAAFTTEGNLKSQASFELQTESSVPRKVTEYMKVSTEMLSDVDYLTGMITQELQYEVDIASNTAALTGTGVAPQPKGVTLYAAAYTLATIVGVTAPNNSDAIRAAIAQLRSTNFTGKLTAYVNPVDAAQMDLSKTLTGQYANMVNLKLDCDVIEDNNIAVGYLLIGDMSKYHIQMYQDFFVQWGWENQDFTKNLITVIGERRFHQWVSSNETGAFIYDTFANIRAAIA